MIRLVNLVQMLLEAPRPLTQDEIQNSLEGMPKGEAARRQIFERAKADLKRAGMPIRTVPVDVEGHAGYGYFIDPADIVLDVKFNEDELVALGSALASVSFGSTSPLDAAGRLGFALEADSPIFVDIPSPTALPVIYEAASKSRLLRFDYSGIGREVETYRIVFRWGVWYLVGYDRTRAAVRVFRVDRIQGPATIEDGERYQIPVDFDLQLVFPSDQWSLQVEESALVCVSVRGDDSTILASQLGIDPIGDDGSGADLFEVSVSNSSPFLDLIFQFGGRLKIIGPDTMLEQLSDWIHRTMMGHADGAFVDWQESDFGGSIDDNGAVQGRSKHPAAIRNANDRFRLLCSILPVLQTMKRASISYLAERFEVDRERLIGLLEAAATCGLPPYTPEMLFELIVDPEADEVLVNVDSALALPQRLDYPAALLLFAASKSVISATGIDSPALSSAVEKLGKAFRDRGVEDPLSIEIDGDGRLSVISDCIATGHGIDMLYNSHSSGRLKDRTVSPVRLFSRDGNWYLEALDLEISEVRIFKVSRILSMSESKVLDGPEQVAVEFSKPEVLRLPADATLGYLEVDEIGLRKIDQVARGYYRRLARRDERWLLELPIVSKKWFFETLCSLGPNARIVGEPDWKRDFLDFALSVISGAGVVS